MYSNCGLPFLCRLILLQHDTHNGANEQGTQGHNSLFYDRSMHVMDVGYILQAFTIHMISKAAARVHTVDLQTHKLAEKSAMDEYNIHQQVFMDCILPNARHHTCFNMSSVWHCLAC